MTQHKYGQLKKKGKKFRNNSLETTIIIIMAVCTSNCALVV
jgi:hypothetical protein